ncbi:MAG: Dot/Icm T4SS effector Wip [Gammaproteobacteria bacterium]
MNIIINDPNANINIYPKPDQSHPADSKNQLTIGDLHGNALKLIYFLIRQNVIILDEKIYPELVRIYQLPVASLTKTDLDSFDKIIASISALPVSTVRLIGDELCDRGSNDYFTLKILERLTELKVPFEILISNHSIDFIDQYETQDDFIPTRLTYDHSRSMSNLQELIKKGLFLRSTIDTLVVNSIKPNLKALSYTLDKDNNKITIYSHAGIDLSVIASLAKKLGVDYCHDSIEHLAQTIDLINAKISLHLRNNTLHTLYLHENIMQGYMSGYSLDRTKSPIEFIMWNRAYSELARPTKHERGYGLDFIHGHDPSDKSVKNIFNLDNSLGKDLNHHQGDYSILYSQELPSYQCDLLAKKLAKPEITAEKKEVDKPKEEFEAPTPKILDEKSTPRVMSKEEKLTFDNHAKTLFAELKKAGLLSEENRQLVYKQILDFMIDTYTSALPILRAAKILTQDTFKKLMDGYFEPEIFATLLELKLLTQDTFNKIISWDYRTVNAVEYAFKKLNKYKDLYTKENISALMNCGEHANQIMAVISLHKEFATQSILDTLVKKSESAEQINSFLGKFPTDERPKYFNIALKLDDKDNYYFFRSTDTLLGAKLANQDNLEILIQFKNTYAVGGLLINLDRAKLLTPENRAPLLKLPKLTGEFISGIDNLISNNIASQENFECLLKANDHFELVAKTLLDLEKSQLCTPFARNLIAKYPQFADDIAWAMKSLHTGKIFSTENLDTIEKSLQSNSPSNVKLPALKCTRILCQLNSVGMLTEQTRELASKSAQHEESINKALRELFDNKLLTPDLCITLLEHGAYADSLASLYTRLDQAKMLTPDMKNTLIKKLPHTHSLSSALWRLQDHKTLSIVTWQLMLENSEHSSELALAYNELSENKLLEHFPVLLKHVKHAWTLAYAIASLKKSGLFTQENYGILIANPEYASDLAEGFRYLSSDNIFTNELRDLLVYFTQQPGAQRYTSTSIAFVLKHLNETNLLNKTCLAHLKTLNNQEVTDMLSFTCLLKKYRILTEANFISIVTGFNQKWIDCKNFCDLLNRLENAGLVSPAKLKRSQATFDKLIECKQFITELKHELKAIVPLTQDVFDKIIDQKREKMRLKALVKAGLTGPTIRFFSAIDSTTREVVTRRPVLFHRPMRT